MTGWYQQWLQAWRQEAFASGVRAFLALATLVGAAGWWGQTQALIPLILGVLAAAIAESDDSWRGQLRAQCAILPSFAVVAWAMQVSLPYPGWRMLVLGCAAFGLTLLGAVGERYRTLALDTLIMAVYTALAGHAPAQGPVGYGPVFWLLCGATWYGLISVLWAAVLPMLSVRQKLATLYEVLGAYLQLKSRLLAPVRGVDLERRRLALALHNGRVVEALNAVKESLFLRMGPGPTPKWLYEALQMYFVAQDIHERVTSSHAHYGALVEAFFHSDALYRCQRVLALLGQDCQTLAAQAILPRGGWQLDEETVRAIADLQAAIDYQETQRRATVAADAMDLPLRALRALADNVLGVAHALGAVLGAWQPGRLPADSSLLNRHPRSLRDAWARVRAQLTLTSPLLRHAIRLTVALLLGDGVMQVTADAHGFWILLTIVFVCQPQYGATLVRLAQRVWGTLLGLVVGWALLRLFPDVQLQSAFAVVAGALFFVTRHSRYTLATAAITALVLLSFNQAGDGFGLINPRLIDTLVGSLISGLAVWLVLPSWQSHQLPRVAAQALRTQACYLQAIMHQYQHGKQDDLAYRLARRNAHNADAALSGCMSAVFQEPAYVRRHMAAGTQFLVLSHTLLNYLSAMGAHRGRGAVLLPDSACACAAACVLHTLETLALGLEGAPATVWVPSDEAQEALWLTSLAQPVAYPLPEGEQVLRAQLTLALRLLPALREQAGALRVTHGSRRAAAGAAARG